MKLAEFFTTIEPFLLGEAAHAGTARALYGDGAARSPDAQRLAIYGRFCQNHREEALERVFSGCRAVLRRRGDAVWQRVLHAYFRAHPMRHFELNQNGAAFPQFLADELAARSPALARDRLPAYLPALADFEWWQWLVFTAPDDAADADGAYPGGDADPDDEAPGGSGPLRLASAVDLRPYRYDLADWLRALTAAPPRSETPAAPRARLAPPPARPSVALVWRDRDLDLCYRTATPLELRLVKALIEGIPVDAALAARVGVTPAELAARCRRLHASGVLRGALPSFVFAIA